MSAYRTYPSYKPSGVEWLGNLPVGWVVTKLKHTVDPGRPITYGIVQAGPDIPGGIPYVRPADMGDECGVIDPESIMRTSPEIVASYTRSAIRTGDLVCSIGPSFGKVMTVPKWLDGGNLTQGTARVAVSKFAHAKFFFWVLLSEESYGQWEGSIGGATFRALNLGPLAETHIALPPLPEQHQIATFLDRECGKLDALQAKQERLIELLKEKRQALISHAVTRGLDPTAKLKPSGIEWLGDVPEHWTVTRLKFEVSKIVDCPHETPKYDPDGEYLVIRTADLDRGRLDLSKAYRLNNEEFLNRTRRERLHPNDIVYGREGERWGHAALVPIAPEVCLGQRMMQFRASGSIEPAYFSHLLNSDAVYEQGAVDTVGATAPHVNISTIRNYNFPLPPLAEQQAIVAHLEEKCGKIDQLKAKAERAIELLKERRSALISAAVTGKIDVRERAF